MKFIIAAGGTGGHIMPALTLTDELRRRGYELCWVGRADGLEAELVRSRGIEFEPIPAAGLAGMSLARRAVWPVTMLCGLSASLRVLRRTGATAVIAAGGYVSAGPLAAARLRELPYFLLEQNRVPGRVTRLFAAGARRVLLAFPTVSVMRAETTVTGNPLRPEISADGRSDDGRTVLVLGGSLGARALNLAALDAAEALTNIRFIIVTGRRDFDLIRSRLRHVNVELVAYTDRPHELYRQATVAVSRAGGMVLSELTAFGIPAIIVPYPHAADCHQAANAEYISGYGAALTLDQSCLSGLVGALKRLLDDPGLRQRMGEAARGLARPDALTAVVEEVEKCLAG